MKRNSRRMYIDGMYGQVHLHFTRSEATQARPLVCLHATPFSGRCYESFMAEMTDRPVYALDTPGYGESDRPPHPISIAEYAEAIWSAIDALEFKGEFDLLGMHTGTRIATEIALAHRQRVRRLILVGCGIYTREEREEQKRWCYDIEIPKPEDTGGAQVMRLWASFEKYRRGGVDDAMLERRVSEVLRDRAYSSWAHLSVFAHDLSARLPLLEQSVLVINADDDLYIPTQRAPALLRRSKLVDLSPAGFGVFESNAPRCAAVVREFLNADD